MGKNHASQYANFGSLQILKGYENRDRLYVKQGGSYSFL